MSSPPHHLLVPAITLTRPRWLAVVIVLTVFVTACSSRTSDTDPTPVLSGPPNTTYPMPPLKSDSEMGWALGNGTRAKLSDYKGKVLVLDFYATWCEPCRASIPHLIGLQRQLGPAGLEIVGLNVGGADDRIKVAAFADELRIDYPLGFPDKDMTDFFLSDDQTIPQTFVFGRDGKLARRLIGYQPSTGVELEKVIASALTQQQTGANAGK